MIHYKFQSERSTFVATYKRSYLCKIEHKRGENSPRQWRGIVFSIPHRESGIDAFKEKYTKVVVSEFKPSKTTKAASLYKEYVADWFLFYYKINGTDPRFNATDGKCIKAIMRHFETTHNTPEDARGAWQAILAKWHKLPEFYRNKTDLAFINAKLNEIITQLKNEQSTTNQAKRDADDLRRRAQS